MDDQREALVLRVEEKLDAMARQCLRTIGSEDITLDEMRHLAKFMFGCMNQKHELRRRVDERGDVEFLKVLEFTEQAAQCWQEIQLRLSREAVE